MSDQIEHPAFGTLNRTNNPDGPDFKGLISLPDGRTFPVSISIDEKIGETDSLDKAAAVHQQFLQQEATLLRNQIKKEIDADHRKTVQLMLDEEGAGEKVTDEWLEENFAQIYLLIYRVNQQLMSVIWEDESGFIGWDLELEMEMLSLN